MFSARKMEAEVIQMCVHFFNGGDDACGTVRIPLLRYIKLGHVCSIVNCHL